MGRQLVRSFRRLIFQRGAIGPTMRFVRHHGRSVGAGPFTGLKYPRFASFRIFGLVPRLAGTYELELRPVIEELVRSQPSAVVNIGAADGYYAIGLALRCPDSRIIAYEAEPRRTRILSRVAHLNRTQIDQRGSCTPDELARLNPPLGTAVICDCEGAEAELIDPVKVEWLRDAMLLVEVHESNLPGIEAKLDERFRDTHAIEWIEPRKRYLADSENHLLWNSGLSLHQQHMLMADLRPIRTPWLWARPKG